MQCCYSVGSETPLNCRGASVGDSKTVHVVGAIIEREGSVCAARRSPERSAVRVSKCPSGKVDLAESTAQALRRLVLQELGIGITVGRFIDRSAGEAAGTTIELSCYEAILQGPDPASSTDHDALSWIHLDRLHEFEWAPGDIPIVDRLPESISMLNPTQFETP